MLLVVKHFYADVYICVARRDNTDGGWYDATQTDALEKLKYLWPIGTL